MKNWEKMILLGTAAALMLVLWLCYSGSKVRKYVNVNCPKCNSEEMVLTHVDNFDVEHILCLSCGSKFTMTEISDMDNVCDSIPEEIETVSSSEEMPDSLYDPEMECPD